MDSMARIKTFFDRVCDAGVATLAVGGDHLSTLPVMRALAKNGPVGMVHFDAHTDTWDGYFGGFKYTHGTPFRRAVEEGLLDCDRVVQIGLRGTGYAAEDFDWCRQQGFRVVTAEECWHHSLVPLMEEVHARVQGGPVYISFDIDGIDPAYAPGTGTPEIGGLTVPQALEIVRGARGLDIVGADLVEVSQLCVLPGVEYRA
jgi:guanidinobutyrase